MGPMGMLAVAMCLSCRINQHGHSETRVAKEWYGRAVPGATAKELAALIIENRLPQNEYLYCMGETVDVKRFGWRDGDAIVRENGQSLHLYKNWPKTRDTDELSEAE